MNATSVVNGMDSIIVGSNDTLATSHVWKANSRHTKRRRGISIMASNATTKNSPTPRIDFEAVGVVVTNGSMLSRGVHSRNPLARSSSTTRSNVVICGTLRPQMQHTPQSIRLASVATFKCALGKVIFDPPNAISHNGFNGPPKRPLIAPQLWPLFYRNCCLPAFTGTQPTKLHRVKQTK